MRTNSLVGMKKDKMIIIIIDNYKALFYNVMILISP